MHATNNEKPRLKQTRVKS